jgi:hypothetical protein
MDPSARSLLIWLSVAETKASATRLKAASSLAEMPVFSLLAKAQRKINRLRIRPFIPHNRPVSSTLPATRPRKTFLEQAATKICFNFALNDFHRSF